jgi:hypothetical protein
MPRKYHVRHTEWSDEDIRRLRDLALLYFAHDDYSSSMPEAHAGSSNWQPRGRAAARHQREHRQEGFAAALRQIRGLESGRTCPVRTNAPRSGQSPSTPRKHASRYRAICIGLGVRIPRMARYAPKLQCHGPCVCRRNCSEGRTVRQQPRSAELMHAAQSDCSRFPFAFISCEEDISVDQRNLRAEEFMQLDRRKACRFRPCCC